MNRRRSAIFASCMALGLLAVGCKSPPPDPKAEAPPPLKVQRAEDRNVFEVERPERFQLARAVAHTARPKLNVTGTVNPDVSRNVPVISLASGRVIEIDARLGDTVTKGQLPLKVQSADISAAYSDYQQAIVNENLSNKQFERSKGLYDRGAIAMKAWKWLRQRKTSPKSRLRLQWSTSGCWASIPTIPRRLLTSLLRSRA